MARPTPLRSIVWTNPVHHLVIDVFIRRLPRIEKTWLEGEGVGPFQAEGRGALDVDQRCDALRVAGGDGEVGEGGSLGQVSVADDVIHIQIRTSRGVITKHDLPNSRYVKALLRKRIGWTQ
ncbi:hypothetical protein ACFOZ0_03870 [Streptomyces yaanensis]|uniref:Uncharacterized protein n=1 Tax=Streptomyces yaanensis TaxID=1142239 RepID=A0ABV7S9H6_9ACTN